MWTGTPLFPEAASTLATRVDALLFYLLAIAIFFSLLIAGLIVYYAVRFKRRSAEEVGARIHGGMKSTCAALRLPPAASNIASSIVSPPAIVNLYAEPSAT